MFLASKPFDTPKISLRTLCDLLHEGSEKIIRLLIGLNKIFYCNIMLLIQWTWKVSRN